MLQKDFAKETFFLQTFCKRSLLFAKSKQSPHNQRCKKALQKRPSFCKRDLLFAKEAFFLQKRPSFCKIKTVSSQSTLQKDFAKEAFFLQKRPSLCKRGLLFAKETFFLQKKPSFCKRDLLFAKSKQSPHNRRCKKTLQKEGLTHDYGVATISRLLKIIGSFAKEPYKTDDILQKRPIILRSLLIVATP